GEFEIYTKGDSEEDSHFWDKVMKNGNYDERSTLSFRVEEYKRPTFEVEFKEINETYKPGDSVMVTGKAATFMGAGINNTVLSYEITRQKPVRRWWHHTFSDPVTVVRDSVTTGAEGNFSIAFTALANEQDLRDDN